VLTEEQTGLDELSEEWTSQSLRSDLTNLIARDEEKLLKESHDKRLNMFKICIGLMWG
jgi:hypothetical protein